MRIFLEHAHVGLYIHQILHRRGSESVAQFRVNKTHCREVPLQLRTGGTHDEQFLQQYFIKWHQVLTHHALHHGLQFVEGEIMINPKTSPKKLRWV